MLVLMITRTIDQAFNQSRDKQGSLRLLLASLSFGWLLFVVVVVVVVVVCWRSLITESIAGFRACRFLGCIGAFRSSTYCTHIIIYYSKLPTGARCPTTEEFRGAKSSGALSI